jgi:hypothetical protein
MYRFSDYLENRDPKLYESLGGDIDEGVLGNLWQGAKQMWGGLKAGYTGAKDAIAGPKAKYESAMKLLQDARTAMGKEAEWQKSTTSGAAGGPPAMNLLKWMDQTIKELDTQAKQIGTKQVAGNTMTAAQPAPGADYDPDGSKP